MNERERQRRRDEMRERRRKKVQRQRRIVLGICGLLILGIVVGIGFGVNALGNRREAKKIGKIAEQSYQQFLDQNHLKEDVSLKDSKENRKGEKEKEKGNFGIWLTEQYPEQVKDRSLSKVIEDGNLTSEESYQVLGMSMHVLKDAYEGHLENAKVAKKQNIYTTEAFPYVEGKKKPVKISIAGDLCFAEDGFVLDHYDEVGALDKCISPEILKITNEADIFYLNHEYTVGNRGDALPGKLYTFQAEPERMKLLQEMGTDLVSLANNHVYDYGEVGLLDTLQYLDEANIPYVGGGRNIEEAKRPIYFVENGLKIGFVAASNAELTLYTPAATEDTPGIMEAYDTAEYNKVIQEASRNCDYLIAYIHWGPEDVNQYADYQTTQGKEFLDSGADIVVGGHPHVLQGMEYMDGKPVIYSMGDFWFNHETKYTGLLNLKISNQGLEKMSFTPCLQTGFTTQYLETKEEQREMYDFMESLSPNISIDDTGVITEMK